MDEPKHGGDDDLAETQAVVDTTGLAPLAARYDLEYELGRGGIGVVYRATDRETGGVVALKVLQEKIAPDRGRDRSASRDR